MQNDNWKSSPDDLDLEIHQVDIWRISLNLPVDSVNSLESYLSADETERAARFHFRAGREHFIAARGCLREILARYLHCEPGQLTFSSNQYGKPELQDHYLEFNLSHSGDYALVGVRMKRKIGVDIERIRSDLGLESIANRFFSQREVSELSALPSEQRVAGFFNCWTRKEAYIKAHGLGLSLPLDSFDVSLTPNKPAILRATRPDPKEAIGWTLFSLEVNPHYMSAVATQGQGLEFRLWDWKIRKNAYHSETESLPRH
jgi:4'-phosphopantetheinyl transferase